MDTPTPLDTARAALAHAAELDPSHPTRAGQLDQAAAEANYTARNAHLAEAARAALAAGLAVGLDHDPADPHPVVLVIELPTGQVTWHLPDGPAPPFPPAARPWDGHDTATKYARLSAWLAVDPDPMTSVSRPVALYRYTRWREHPAEVRGCDTCGCPWLAHWVGGCVGCPRCVTGYRPGPLPD